MKGPCHAPAAMGSHVTPIPSHDANDHMDLLHGFGAGRLLVNIVNVDLPTLDVNVQETIVNT